MGIGTTRNTFILSVKIGDFMATALVDSGSTSTFVSPEIASKMSVAPMANTKVKVIVASGKVLWNEFTVEHCPYEIQGTRFCDFQNL